MGTFYGTASFSVNAPAARVSEAFRAMTRAEIAAIWVGSDWSLTDNPGEPVGVCPPYEFAIVFDSDLEALRKSQAADRSAETWNSGPGGLLWRRQRHQTTLSGSFIGIHVEPKGASSEILVSAWLRYASPGYATPDHAKQEKVDDRAQTIVPRLRALLLKKLELEIAAGAPPERQTEI